MAAPFRVPGFRPGFQFLTGAAAIGGLAATSFASAAAVPNVQIHVPTATITTLGGTCNFMGTVSGATLTVQSVQSGAISIGMTLTVPGPYLQQDDVRILSGSGTTWTISTSVTPTAYSTSTAMIADGTKVVTAISDVNGNPALTATLATAPLLHIDGYGRKWLRFTYTNVGSNIGSFMTNTTLAGLDNCNVTWAAVARFHGGHASQGTIVAHNPGGTFHTVASVGNPQYAMSSATNGTSAPYPIGFGAFTPTAASAAIRSRMILGAQPQVVTISHTDNSGLGVGTTPSVTARLCVNEQSYTPAAVAQTKSGSDIGYALGTSSATGAASLCFDVAELVGWTTGQMGTPSTQAARVDQAQALMVANWAIPAVVDSYVLAGDSRYDYNYQSGSRPALLLTEPGGSYSLPASSRVVDVSVAGGISNDASIRLSSAPAGILASPVLTGKNVIVTAWGHNDLLGVWPYTVTAASTTARADEVFNGACSGTFTATITGSIFAPQLTVSGYTSAGGFGLKPGMVVTGSGIPPGTRITGFVSGTNGSDGVYTLNTYAAVSSVAATATFPTFIQLINRFQTAGFSVLGATSPEGSAAATNALFSHYLNDVATAMAADGFTFTPSKYTTLDVRALTVAGTFPLGVNFAAGNGYILQDVTHMNDAGRGLLVPALANAMAMAA